MCYRMGVELKRKPNTRLRLFVLWVLGVATTFWLTGCSSAPIKDKWTTTEFRVLLDPEGIPAMDYVRIQNALVRSGRFFVVDRAQGFRAVATEQNLTHGPEHFSRFGDPERYSELGKLYGVGAIVVAHVDCITHHSVFKGEYPRCHQNLAFVNASTAEVIATADGVNDDGESFYGQMRLGSDWTDTTNGLISNIPKEFEIERYDARMKLKRREIAEKSQREREAR